MPFPASRTDQNTEKGANPRERLLQLLNQAQGSPAGLLNAPPAELTAWLKKIFALALEEGARGNAARAAIRQVIDGFQQLAALQEITRPKE